MISPSLKWLTLWCWSLCDCPRPSCCIVVSGRWKDWNDSGQPGITVLKIPLPTYTKVRFRLKKLKLLGIDPFELNLNTLDNVNKGTCIVELRQDKASRLNVTAMGGESGALELLIVLVEVLGESGLRLDPPPRLLGVEPLDPAPVLRPEPPLAPKWTPPLFPKLGKGGIDQEEDRKKESK